MHIERIVYPKLGIIDEIEVEDDEEETEDTEKKEVKNDTGKF